MAFHARLQPVALLALGRFGPRAAVTPGRDQAGRPEATGPTRRWRRDRNAVPFTRHSTCLIRTRYRGQVLYQEKAGAESHASPRSRGGDTPVLPWLGNEMPCRTVSGSICIFCGVHEAGRALLA